MPRAPGRARDRESQVRHVDVAVVLDETLADRHPEPDRDVHRREVRIAHYRVDLRHNDVREAPIQARGRSLRGISETPPLPQEVISDLDDLCRCSALNGETAVPDDLVGLRIRHGPQPEPVVAIAAELALDPGGRLRRRETMLVRAHRDLVAEHTMQRRMILRRELSQPEPSRLYAREGSRRLGNHSRTRMPRAMARGVECCSTCRVVSVAPLSPAGLVNDSASSPRRSRCCERKPRESTSSA